jgi:hypothetical protein
MSASQQVSISAIDSFDRQHSNSTTLGDRPRLRACWGWSARNRHGWNGPPRGCGRDRNQINHARLDPATAGDDHAAAATLFSRQSSREREDRNMPRYRFGKHPPKADYRTLRFRDYASGLAAPPAAADTLPRVYEKLNVSDPAVLFPMDGNDTLGDCTIAALAHAVTTYHGLLGTRDIMSRAAVVKLYMHLTGGVDSGLNELDVLNYWRKNRVGGDRILAFASIVPKNLTHIRQAIQIFGGVYLGFQVQENCVQEFNNHQPWTPGPLTPDGHAVFAVAYDQAGVTVLTWGNIQKGTWAWWDECVDEAYALLPPEARNPAFAPGFNFAQLEADLNAVAV